MKAAFIYALKNNLNGLVKIGKATSVADRVEDLRQQAAMLGLRLELQLVGYAPLDDPRQEFAVHRVLKNARVTGEWFAPNDVLVSDFCNAVIRRHVGVSEWLVAHGTERLFAAPARRPMSLRAYGRHRHNNRLAGGHAIAVVRAIRAGRLKDSVISVGGVARIVSADLADREWARHPATAPGAES